MIKEIKKRLKKSEYPYNGSRTQIVVDLNGLRRELNVLKDGKVLIKTIEDRRGLIDAEEYEDFITDDIEAALKRLNPVQHEFVIKSNLGTLHLLKGTYSDEDKKKFKETFMKSYDDMYDWVVGYMKENVLNNPNFKETTRNKLRDLLNTNYTVEDLVKFQEYLCINN